MSDPPIADLLAALPSRPAAEELPTRLLDAAHVRVERVVSVGHASPPGFRYDQDDGEWVAVLAGQARLSIDGEAAPRVLGPGDFVDLPAHTRHRVEWTDPAVPTVWLAVFYR